MPILLLPIRVLYALFPRFSGRRHRSLLKAQILVVVVTIFSLVSNSFQDVRVFFVAIRGIQLFAWRRLNPACFRTAASFRTRGLWELAVSVALPAP
jgi:hypothetical protein